MQFTELQLKEILLDQGYIEEKDFDNAEKYAKSHNTDLMEYFFVENVLSKELIGQAVSEYFGVPYIDLGNEKIDENMVKMIPEMVSRNKKVVAISADENGVKVGMQNPRDLETKNFVEKKLGQVVKVFYIDEEDLQKALSVYGSDIDVEVTNLLKSLNNSRLSNEERDDLVVEFVDMVLKYGFENNASDIHITPQVDKVTFRFRIDGVMHDVFIVEKNKAPRDFLSFILTRIKILSKMATDIHFAAQDGKMRYLVNDSWLDIRISIIPITYGENIVMRLLYPKNRQLGLVDLGLDSENLQKVKKAIKNPHGMILVTGPTGSGKTTTLYSILKILNKREINLATIEDPVEYDIEGITQIQVNPKTNLTFAKGLRSLVRQDPDILMVGEIRDAETADIAINSALTGHLVLSTLHTNDAVTALPRLLDMGIQPFLVSSTINLVIAQRLVRKICNHCRTSYKLTKEEMEVLLENEQFKDILHDLKVDDFSKARIYKGSGCKVCSNTGYNDRLGIFEVLELDEKVRSLVLQHSSSDVILKQAIQSGMTTMLYDGISKVLNGVTTIQEVMRVTQL
ncbi:MAG: GspE/PulE family protein [Candidatus Magasanikbacteria bacterium]